MSLKERFRRGRSRLRGLPWRRGAVRVLVCAAIVAGPLAAGAIRYIYFDRTNLPDLEAFSRFEFPTIGHVYDADGRPLIEMASEYRQITRYEDIPPILRDAILAAEDKNFFSHMGKTGTTNESRDALFVGSTYGPEEITVAVRIGFDDNRSLGAKATGAKAAPPVFREIVLGAYGRKLVGPAPRFPAEMEQRIDVYLKGDVAETTVATSVSLAPPVALTRGLELLAILKSQLWPFRTAPRRLRLQP